MPAKYELEAAIAVTRFGLGARPGEIAEASADPRGWLKAQIRRAGADQPVSTQGEFASVGDSLILLADYGKDMRKRRQAGEPPNRRMLSSIRTGFDDELLARTRLAALTPAGFRERWSLFWSNHFTVSAKGIRLTAGVGPFEREAIRPNVFGRFEDLLIASSRHATMLTYLDQARSVGPDSPLGQQTGRGLNENLAREIMELHTVGPDAGYTQADVTEFARALTGWSLAGPQLGGDVGSFLFRTGLHEPGDRQVMDRNYGAGGEEQARKVLATLAAHPSTGRRIARKLAVHFVADEPPGALVERLERAWSETDGDLSAVAAALVDAPEAWAPAAAKFKTPYELVASGYRALCAAPSNVYREITEPLNVMGNRPFGAPQPNGWSDLATDWAAPDALVKRLAWARAFSRRYGRDARPRDVAESALGARLTGPTVAALDRVGDPDAGVALLLMSPEFQRR